MNQKGHGLVLEEITDDNYVLGGVGSLGGDVIRPDRDWTSFLPKSVEVQNLNDIEPEACATFGTLNGVEVLIKLILNEDRDYSDRWLAEKSGTDPHTGNSPHKVAETLRSGGVVRQETWKFDATVQTVEEFYEKPPTALDNLAKDFIKEFDFKHEYVPCDAKSLYDALQYSPLGFSVYAWEKEGDFYIRPQGAIDNHWTLLVNAEWGVSWTILDSYMDHGLLLKKLRWDALPKMAKRYKISKQIQKKSLLESINEFLKALFYGDLNGIYKDDNAA